MSVISENGGKQKNEETQSPIQRNQFHQPFGYNQHQPKELRMTSENGLRVQPLRARICNLQIIKSKSGWWYTNPSEK